MGAKTAAKAGAKKGADGPRILTAVERRQLAGETLCHEDTILRWERGGNVRPATRRVLDEAARRLDMPVPERRTT